MPKLSRCAPPPDPPRHRCGTRPRRCLLSARSAHRRGCTDSCCAQTSLRRPPSTRRRRSPGAPSPARPATSSSSRLSGTFRDNGVIYNNATLLTPVERRRSRCPGSPAPPLPLRARPRTCRDDPGPWSAAYGFDVTPRRRRFRFQAPPGVLRWTPVNGADGYEVWLIDTGTPPVDVRPTFSTSASSTRSTSLANGPEPFAGASARSARTPARSRRSVSTASRIPGSAPGAPSTAPRTPPPPVARSPWATRSPTSSPTGAATRRPIA